MIWHCELSLARSLSLSIFHFFGFGGFVFIIRDILCHSKTDNINSTWMNLVRVFHFFFLPYSPIFLDHYQWMVIAFGKENIEQCVIKWIWQTNRNNDGSKTDNFSLLLITLTRVFMEWLAWCSFTLIKIIVGTIINSKCGTF